MTCLITLSFGHSKYQLGILLGIMTGHKEKPGRCESQEDLWDGPGPPLRILLICSYLGGLLLTLSYLRLPHLPPLVYHTTPPSVVPPNSIPVVQ